MEKTFSKIEIAIIKRTAQNVAQYVNKKEKLLAEIEKIKNSKQELIDKFTATVDDKIAAKVAKVEAEIAVVQPMIDSFQTPIKDLTGGYTTEDLVTKEITHTGKMDANGKEILQTRYVLKYPETVVPEDVCNDEAPADPFSNPPVTEKGNDFDLDSNPEDGSDEASFEAAKEAAETAFSDNNEW